MDKNHKDPDTIDLEAPRLAQYMHKAWKRHQNTVYWVDIKIIQKNCSIRRDRTLSFFTTHSRPVVFLKLFGWKLEISKTKKYFSSPRPPPKISLKHDWMKEWDSEVARQPEGEVARQAKSSQSTEPNSNRNHK